MTSLIVASLQSAKSPPIGSVLVWVGAFMTLTLFAGLGVLWYRKQVLAKSSDAGTGTMMEEFRRMRDSGEMTAEEFEATRRALAAKLRGQLPINSDKHGHKGVAGADTDQKSPTNG